MPALTALDLFRLEGSRAIVTGGGGGLGSSIAEALRDAGATVLLVGRSSRTTEIASALGCVGLRADLTDRRALRRTFDRAVRRLDGLDILVTSHGIGERHTSLTLPVEEWDDVLETNLHSVFQLCQLAGEVMVAQGRGKILTVASNLGLAGARGVAAYAASKGGVVQLTRALACDWGPKGVNVNALAPGYLKSSLNETLWQDPEVRAGIEERLPAARWGEPADIRGAAIFLTSRASDFVHGVVLPVDGGWLAS